MPLKVDWDSLTATSHYQTAVEIKECLQQRQVVEAMTGLDALIEAMSRSDRRALMSQLTRLMAHIIKWKCQPSHRSRSWVSTILNARDEIEDIQQETPSLNRSFIESVWDKCWKRAVREAEAEMDQSCNLASLSWKEVFEDEYVIDSL